MLLPFARASGLDFIRLVAPTTDDTRLPLVMAGSSGFIYYVAITGITGTRSATSEHLAQAIPRIRKATDLPIAIGFGLRTPAQAGEASRIADAAVVASALIDTLSHHLDEHGRAKPDAVAAVLDQVRELAAAVRQTQG
jgi:tryptophan synthase alpha chain